MRQSRAIIHIALTLVQRSVQALFLCLNRLAAREEVLQNYVTNLFKLYNDVPYHNVYHAFAVFQGCYWIVKQKDSGMAKNLTRLNHFSLLVAALAHDTGHMGCDNAFHANKYDELSITYNDKSLLESLHARNCFEVAKNTPDCNIFAAFDRAAFKACPPQQHTHTHCL